jgi:hypothetical protein
VTLSTGILASKWIVPALTTLAPRIALKPPKRRAIAMLKQNLGKAITIVYKVVR